MIRQTLQLLPLEKQYWGRGRAAIGHRVDYDFKNNVPLE